MKKDSHDAYIAAAPEQFRTMLGQLRAQLSRALPDAEEVIKNDMPGFQIEQTIIGHLHSNLILWKSRCLAGMPRITFLGHTAKRLSTALGKARGWRSFNVRLCPALAGIELLKDGGYLSLDLDLNARRPVRIQFHPIKYSRR